MVTALSRNGRATAVGPDRTNGAAETLDLSIPYRVEFTVCGDADILFHRWNCEAVEAKAKAAKGSKAKKSDDIESYVYRNDKGELCLPGEYVRQAVVAAAKFKQDPRSPRKSAADLVKAAVVSLSPLATLYTPASAGDPRLVEASRDQVRLGREWQGMAPAVDWCYEHACRVQVQRNGITRVRPALKAGWRATMVFMVNLPEYVSESFLQQLLSDAGRLIGVGDFRPSYGRFQITSFARCED